MSENRQSNVITEGQAQITGQSDATVFYNPVQEFNRDLSIALIKTYRESLQKESYEHLNNFKMSENRQSNVITEGQAQITGQSDATVFYNPVQEFNRDLSIALIKTYSESLQKDEKLCIFEGLSATGLRSIRYAKELSSVSQIYANDLDKVAFGCIRDNIERNGVGALVQPLLGDCNANLCKLVSEGTRPNVVDVDPFGSPAIFIDTAVRMVSEGGLLLVTATDLAVLCGQVPEKSYSLYGSLSVKTPCMHENALRILLYCMSRQAAMHGRYIIPQLSFFKDFYIRVAVTVHTKAFLVKDVCLKHSVVNYCSQCTDFILNPLALKSGPSKYVHATVRGGQKCKQCESGKKRLVILLYCMSRQAAMHGRYIIPQLSFFKDFYIRVAVTVHTKAFLVKDVCLKHSVVNYCSQCTDFILNPLALKSGPSKYVHATVRGGQKCKQCESAMRMGGPIWNGRLHNPDFVTSLLGFIRDEGSSRFGSWKKILATVSLISEELPDSPLFLTKEMMFSAAKVSGPKLTLVSSAILNAGFKFSVSHCSPVAVKTDAPSSFLWDIVRQFERDHPVNREKLSPFSKALLEQTITHKIDFTLHPAANPVSRTSKVTRFPINPPNWGPKARPRPQNATSNSAADSHKNGSTSMTEISEPPDKKQKCEKTTSEVEAN
ncbi:tRNA (guanine(26)-N(2))-dimethyltransferase-like [Symsagittifera roscoffensis]|uniref:tRNA (guanine(26)-N(2))-dimethyltransferase-like n=1 Tax=Symsagittifera roscoffensis TaxID=84072 RepID=UPI00307BB98E